MSPFEIRNPDYRETIRRMLDLQPFIRHLGVELGEFGPGFCELALDLRPEHLQHGGVAHAGVISTLADNAAGAAAGTLMPPGHATVTAEYRISLLNPGAGKRLLARGEVLRPGKALLHVKADVWAFAGERRTHCATLLGTMVPFNMGGAD